MFRATTGSGDRLAFCRHPNRRYRDGSSRRGRREPGYPSALPFRQGVPAAGRNHPRRDLESVSWVPSLRQRKGHSHNKGYKEETVSCNYSTPHKPHQMRGELNKQPKDDDAARYVRDQPARVFDNLENARVVVVIKASLIKRQTAVPQRIVHEDQRFSAFAVRGIGDTNSAGKILGDIRSSVPIVAELKKLD